MGEVWFLFNLCYMVLGVGEGHVPGHDVVFEVLAHHKCIQLHNDLLWSLLLLVVRMSFYLFFWPVMSTKLTLSQVFYSAVFWSSHCHLKANNLCKVAVFPHGCCFIYTVLSHYNTSVFQQNRLIVLYLINLINISTSAKFVITGCNLFLDLFWIYWTDVSQHRFLRDIIGDLLLTKPFYSYLSPVT